MLENLFSFHTILPQSGIDAASFAVCLLCAVLSGILLSACFRFRNRAGQSILLTLAVLPPIVTVIVMLVGDHLGAGVALAGAFSLVRFRSQPGTAREICALLLACTVGFACGSGYLLIAVVLLLLTLAIGFVYLLVGVGRCADERRILKITIPETLDYTGLFDDLLEQYTTYWSCISVKTTEMGSLYHLTYEISLKDASAEKPLIDALRCRNGNLEILCGRPQDRKGEL